MGPVEVIISAQRWYRKATAEKNVVMHGVAVRDERFVNCLRVRDPSESVVLAVMPPEAFQNRQYRRS